MTVDSQKIFQWLSRFCFLVLGFFLGVLCSSLLPFGCITFQNFSDFFSNIKTNFFYNSHVPFFVLFISLLLGHLWNWIQKKGASVHPLDQQLENRRIEGLKALADWSKWSITIQASFIAIVTFKLGENTVINETIPNSIDPALLSFTLSIFTATILLGAIPDALAVDKANTTEKPSNDIYRHSTNLVFSIGAFATAEHILFLFGILAISLELTS